jgi:hypothetical protein
MSQVKPQRTTQRAATVAHSAPENVTHKPIPQPNDQEAIWRVVGVRVVSGLVLGMGLCLLAAFSSGPAFVRFMDDFLTGIPIGLLYLGGGAMTASLFLRLEGLSKASWLLKFSDTWFDLVQQFLCIAAGAYLPVKLAVFIAEQRAGHVVTVDWWHGTLTFILLMLFASVGGGVWEAAQRDELPDRKFWKFVYAGVMLLAVGGSAIMLKSVDYLPAVLGCVDKAHACPLK